MTAYIVQVSLGDTPQGTLEYQIEDKPPVTLKAGDVLFIPAGTVHSARNPGSVTGSDVDGDTLTFSRKRRSGRAERIASTTWSTRPSRSESARRLSPLRPARADRTS